MRAVAVHVAIALPGEVLLDQLDSRERGMGPVDSRVEDGDDDIGARVRRRVGPDGPDPPRIARLRGRTPR